MTAPSYSDPSHLHDGGQTAASTLRRWLTPTIAKVLGSIMVVQMGLYVSQAYRWFPFNREKGWTVLITLAVTAILLSLFAFGLLVAWITRAKPQFTLAALFMLFSMANSGLPGTSGFVGEFMVILGAVKANFWYAFAAAHAGHTCAVVGVQPEYARTECRCLWTDRHRDCDAGSPAGCPWERFGQCVRG